MKKSLLLISMVLFLAFSYGCFHSEADSYYIKAIRLSKEGGDPEKIFGLYTKAIEKEPNSPSYLRGRGIFLFDLERYQAAVKDLSKSCETIDRGTAYRLYLKGLTQGKLKDFEGAKESFQEAIELQRINSQFYYGLALSEMMLGNLNAALNAINKTIELRSNMNRNFYAKAAILSLMGRKEEAIELFNQTSIYTLAATANKKMTDVFFDGNLEYKRIINYSPDDLLVFWHYGGRWLPRKVYDFYKGN